MLLPSKELLSEVLSKEFNFMFGISDISTYNNLVQISFYETELCSMCGLHQINIYELAHKCKEWAFDKEYSVYATQYKIDDGEWCIYVFKDKDMHDYGCDICDTTFKTEPEAIFKACEWIMEKENEK